MTVGFKHYPYNTGGLMVIPMSYQDIATNDVK